MGNDRDFKVKYRAPKVYPPPLSFRTGVDTYNGYHKLKHVHQVAIESMCKSAIEEIISKALKEVEKAG